MTQAEQIERYVKRHGEKHRDVVIDAIRWLDNKELEWKRAVVLAKSLDRDAFVADLIANIERS